MSWSMLGKPGPRISNILKRIFNIIRIFMKKDVLSGRLLTPKFIGHGPKTCLKSPSSSAPPALAARPTLSRAGSMTLPHGAAMPSTKSSTSPTSTSRCSTRHFPPSMGQYAQPHTRAWAARSRTSTRSCSSRPNTITRLGCAQERDRFPVPGMERQGGRLRRLRRDRRRPRGRAIAAMMGELKVADVRAQVALSLFTDFENFTTFKPRLAGSGCRGDAQRPHPMGPRAAAMRLETASEDCYRPPPMSNERAPSRIAPSATATARSPA